MFSQRQRFHQQAESILLKADQLKPLGEAAFQRSAKELIWAARSGHPLHSLLDDVFALGVEASRRTLGLRHYPVQVMGGISLIHGHVAEMQTGEGKTLTAVLPVLLRAMVGRGVHVVTVNDYLATRDAEQMGKIFSSVGLSTGCVVQQMSDTERAQQYQCDITYGTASEMGFDFLRDRLKRGTESGLRTTFKTWNPESSSVQRGQYFALIDEVDSVLIDEARTPLIIGVEQQNKEATISLYRWCRDSLGRLKPNQDFLFDERQRSVFLTDVGCRHVTLMAKPVLLDSLDTERIYQGIEKALTAHLAFECDRDYIIDDGEIVIVDEGTGRKMEGRKWQDGLHQSVEAKERVEITAATGSAAKITLQSLYRHYKHLAGMTGTAVQVRSELRKIYKLKVSVIPTHRPCLRKEWPTRIFVSLRAKHDAIIQSIQEIVSRKRAVLIGTPSVEASQFLSQRLTEEGIEHLVLNALFHEEEAAIVKQAGETGRVTIATNMAGRGTDILLEDEVRKNGGLHVIGTEIHSSKRIDRQLVGRNARQGDPGTFQFFLSLEDELLRVLPPDKREQLLQRGHSESQGELAPRWIRTFTKVQRMLEKTHSKTRRKLQKFEKKRTRQLREAGLDPFVEAVE